AARAANSILTMCIRAFEYLPPVDIRFGDYLRALVTADYDLIGEDGFEQRRAMIEAFRLRGVYPDYVHSLAEDSLLWERPDEGLEPIPKEGIPQIMQDAARAFRRRPSDPTDPRKPEFDDETIGDRVASDLHEWAKRNAAALDLDPERPIQVQGFHSIFRVAP